MKNPTSKFSYFGAFMLFTFLIGTVVSGTSHTASGADNEIVEAAKKESGEILAHISMRLGTAKKLAEAFRGKYPFVKKVNQYRADSQRMLERALSEYRAGRHTIDVIQASPYDLAALQKEEVIGLYDSPERKFIDERFKDKEGYWTDLYWYPVIIAYNTDLVPAGEAPKSWQDLLQPKWKGKITMPRDQIGWYRVMAQKMGEEKAKAFMKEFSKQDIRISKGISDGVTLLAAGEFHLAVTRAQHIEIFKHTKGAPVDWVKDLDPMAVHGTPVAITKYPPNPNTAKLFIDFLLSKEAAEIVAESRRLPARTDVKGLSSGFKQMNRKNLVRTPDEEIFANFDKYRSEFRGWFGGPK